MQIAIYVIAYRFMYFIAERTQKQNNNVFIYFKIFKK